MRNHCGRRRYGSRRCAPSGRKGWMRSNATSPPSGGETHDPLNRVVDYQGGQLLNGDRDVVGIGAERADLQFNRHRVPLRNSGRNPEKYEVDPGVYRMETGECYRGRNPANRDCGLGGRTVIECFVAGAGIVDGAWRITVRDRFRPDGAQASGVDVNKVSHRCGYSELARDCGRWLRHRCLGVDPGWKCVSGPGHSNATPSGGENSRREFAHRKLQRRGRHTVARYDHGRLPGAQVGLPGKLKGHVVWKGVVHRRGNSIDGDRYAIETIHEMRGE